VNSTESNFLQAAAPAAMASCRATGVPASVTMAQAILESGWGQHMPAGSNNPFGIKALDRDQPNSYVEAMTTEDVGGQVEHVAQPFQKFADLADAFTEHAQLLAHATRYAPAMAVKDDARAFAQQLESCGYSTNRPPLAPGPKFYADELLELMAEFDLGQYDSSSLPAA
jgi:flagellum-specific peptidoglycan hydrolase FlgJ